MTNPLNPKWAQVDKIYIAMFSISKKKLLAILAPTPNGYIYVWHNDYIPKVVMGINPEINPHIQYVLVGGTTAADLTYCI